MKKLIILLVYISCTILYANQFQLSASQTIQNAETAEQFNNVHSLIAQTDHQFQTLLQKAEQEKKMQLKIQQEMQSVKPHVMAALFLNQLDKAENPQELLTTIAAQIQRNETTYSLSGQVLVDGQAPSASVRVLAFDKFGYYNGSAECDFFGNYSIANLSAGSYYVLTRSSNYVDELYNNIAFPFFGNGAWKNASQVELNADVDGINFDLQTAARLTGTLTNAQGQALGDSVFVDFIITSSTDSLPQAMRFAVPENGQYEIYVPALGECKIMAAAPGFEPIWYTNSKSWSTADVVNIAENGQTYTANFQLTEKTTLPTGSIAGSVMPAVVAVAFAFDASDTTFAGLGIGLGLFAVNYTIENLPPGEYFVYADDYIGSLIGAQNMQGAYYDGANGSHTFAGAKKVTVQANQTTEFINFMLDTGSSISGKVSNAQGTALDSVTIILLNKDILDSGEEPPLTKLDVQIFSTDFNGEYSITGLKPGQYLLRTLVDYTIAFSLDGGDLLVPGKHAGKYVDEFNDGEQSLFKILEVEPVAITEPGPISGVNFELETANFISGTVTDAQTGLPAHDAMIVALQDTSGFPYFPIASIDKETGTYNLGPLPQGNYKLVAIPDMQNDLPYLPEFYNDKRSFWNADVVALNQPQVNGIHFALDHGATIQGFINVAESGIENFADYDSLAGIPVVAYHAESGKTASYDFVQFNGGFRINKLLAGDYKVCVLPGASQFSAGFYGDAADFAAADAIALTAGEVKEIELALPPATGMIHGKVTHLVSGEALSHVLVCAFDETGHMAGFDMTGYNMLNEQKKTDNGTFHISGLIAGKSYYVRTFSLMSNMGILESLGSAESLLGDLELETLLGGGLGLPSFNLDLQLFGDYWYPEIPATLQFNLNDFFFNLISFGSPSEEDISLTPIFLPLPFAETVPAGAMMITAEAGAGAQVDFKLNDAEALGDIVTDVQTEQTLTEYRLQQNYPNPFNPHTTISYQLPETAQVKLTIYDITGRKVSELVNQRQNAGAHSISFDASTLSSGVYLYQLETTGWKQTKQMLLIK